MATAEQIETSRKRPEACYIIEGDWDNEKEETDERTMGREIPSEDT